MIKYLLGIAVLFVIFLSGALPYTLIYSEKSAQDLGVEKPIEAFDPVCSTDSEEYQEGDDVQYEFNATLANNTNRYLMVSVEGDIMPPKRPTIFKYHNMLLSPHETQNVHFKASTTFGGGGKYTCRVTYKIGWLNY